MQFRFELMQRWPTLAWLAKGTKADGSITVYHGPGVETSPTWFCEAVWDGPFSAGDFDQTDIVAGSGARIRDDEIVFVAPGNTVDRLQWFEDDTNYFVSNSLSCLMAFTNASPDPIYKKYLNDAVSVISGLDRYKRTLSTDRGEIRLVYFHNLVWNAAGMKVREKPGLNRDFSNFEKYHAFLKNCMSNLMGNLSAGERKFKLQPMGTLSSGYDSTAISVLAKQYGLTEVITFKRAREGDDDSGATTAAHLGLRVHSVDREDWRKQDFPEIPFLASYSSAEDLVFRAAGELLHGRVLFTGYHGDKVWDKATPYLSDQIVRGDPSGLPLTEYRLECGFINCAVPFFGTRQIRSIHKISNASEMSPWNVPGDYNRPICRRIGEEAGLPRESFGMKKKAVTVSGWDVFDANGKFLTARSESDFLQWIRDHRHLWLKRGRVPPIANSQFNFFVNKACMHTGEAARWLANHTPLWRIFGDLTFQPRYLSLYLFPWAIDRMKRRYPI